MVLVIFLDTLDFRKNVWKLEELLVVSVRQLGKRSNFRFKASSFNSGHPYRSSNQEFYLFGSVYA